MTERTWRLDTVGALPATRDIKEDAEHAVRPNSAPMVSAHGPSPPLPTAARFLGRWNQAVRSWAAERIKRFGDGGARFEDLIHELSAIIATTDDPVAVEAALLRQARRLVPAFRIELLTGGDSGIDQGVQLAADCAECGSTNSSSCPGAAQSVRSVLEVPLRCGAIVRGRLRIRSRTRSVTSLSQETIRRLTALCTMGACALDTLSHHRDWPWDDDVAHLPDSPEVGPAQGTANAGATFHRATLLHDATFLNAVLPFALNQARRHREPLSLMCVAIDRLTGIQELLGRAAVDNLVRKVGETMAHLIRVSDIVARLDDDRLVAVLPRAPGRGALSVAQKICSAVLETSHKAYEIPSVSVSIGVASFPSCADNVFSLLDAADDALARAQTQGRKQAVLAAPRGQAGSHQPCSFSCPS
jgi:diguanylate cyclase (GGDEF)-like protein